jgi:hypothetical protein
MLQIQTIPLGGSLALRDAAVLLHRSYCTTSVTLLDCPSVPLTPVIEI